MQQMTNSQETFAGNLKGRQTYKWG